jgi:acetyl esterase/lipase
MLGVNAGYRLAPAAPWPAGAEDIGAIVSWLRASGARYGGDPSRIYLIGHSAGATHVAGYAFDPSLQPAAGPGVSGVVLMSGRYHIAPAADDPNAANVRACFGTDPANYPSRSAISHIDSAQGLPTFVVIAE